MFRGRSQCYRSARRMAVNRVVQQLCKCYATRNDIVDDFQVVEVGFMDVWDSFVENEMHARNDLHLCGKGVTVLADGLTRAVDSVLGNACYFKLVGQGVCQIIIKTDKMTANPREYASKAGARPP